MNEAEFLKRYDPTAFERLSVAVDLVLMSIVEGEPAVLLGRRNEHPFKDRWALPGGFVAIDESLDDAARRLLTGKARMEGAYLEQLYTFGAIDRDPRMRIISVAYFALLPSGRFADALAIADDLTLAKLIVPWEGHRGGSVSARSRGGEDLPLAFDHADMLASAMMRLRGKLDYSDIGFALLPQRFTLRDLQDVHEAIRGERLNKPAFRRRMLDRGWIQPTGEREAGASFRPAELYRYHGPSKGDD